MKIIIYLFCFIFCLNVDAQKLKVAVLDPTTSGIGIDTGTKLAVQELISSAVVSTGKYSVVERSMIESILKEQSFSNSDFVDNTQATEIGRLSGANKVFVSAISLVGGRNMLSVKLIDVTTATIENQQAKVVQSADLLDLVEPLVLKALGFLDELPEFKTNSNTNQPSQQIKQQGTVQHQRPVVQPTQQSQTRNYVSERNDGRIDIPKLSFYVLEQDEYYGGVLINWHNAVSIGQSKGNGWRLPTRQELKDMAKYMVELNLHPKSGYWSSESKNRREAYYYDMKDKEIDDDDKDDADKRVRLVKIK